VSARRCAAGPSSTGARRRRIDWSRAHARRRGAQTLRRLETGDWPSAATVNDLYGTWASALSDAWPGGAALRVRMALHTGDARLRDEGNYFGPAVIRCARLRTLAHGGQVLLSRATYDLVREGLPEGVELVDFGEYRLRDLGRPEHVFALSHPALPAALKPLHSRDAPTHNLPLGLSSFVGRERELDELRTVLKTTRLLTPLARAAAVRRGS
jgi:hypothetical protein